MPHCPDRRWHWRISEGQAIFDSQVRLKKGARQRPAILGQVHVGSRLGHCCTMLEKLGNIVGFEEEFGRAGSEWCKNRSIMMWLFKLELCNPAPTTGRAWCGAKEEAKGTA